MAVYTTPRAFKMVTREVLKSALETSGLEQQIQVSQKWPILRRHNLWSAPK
jgi:hypothetical protein